MVHGVEGRPSILISDRRLFALTPPSIQIDRHAVIGDHCHKGPRARETQPEVCIVANSSRMRIAGHRVSKWLLQTFCRS